MTAGSAANADQIEYWNGEAGRKWARLQDALDSLFAEITVVAVEHAAPRHGEAVVDVGCGCGATVLALAERVGPRGRVTGVDVSAVMLERARERAAALAQVSLLEADAAQHAFAPRGSDLMFSRFGVMFFRNPDEAFINLRRGLKDDGRLVFACWRGLEESSFMHLPLAAVAPILPLGDRPGPEEPGPFAFADPARVGAIMSRAGFASPAIEARTLPLRAGGLEHALMLVTQVGPTARALADASPEQREAAVEAIRRALEQRLVDGEVRLDAGIWLVSARPG